MHAFVIWSAAFLFAAHSGAVIWRWPRNGHPRITEMVRQHHERAALLALIALAVATH